MKGLTYILVKILSIYFFVEIITENIPQVFGIINMWGTMEMVVLLGIIISVLIKLVIILYLWFSADKISNLIISNSDNSIDKINYKEVHIIIFSVLGIILLAVSIPELVQYISEYIIIPGKVVNNLLPELIAKLVEVIIGILLLIGSHKIVDIISKE